ncbi:MAG: hypothetical protein GAK28_00629 [Luteibacter sp.]|uniref:phage adaptor protein n=1 Tax=Luteibacter sp. TaxID=1886636 RepID=UPI001384BCF8|nr:hypothetical protein [Luteibacter sp.]KAF1008997.1 MAG: hypothetical protein GAK28_00629 [Luteibacter sp.]
MATFLELCKDVHRIARIGEDPPGTAPETVVGQEGVLFEVINWVQDAYRDIQEDQRDWAFRERSATVTIGTVRTVDALLLPDDYEALRPFTADFRHRNILVAPTGTAPSASQPVWFIEWEDWRGGRYERGQAAGATGMPGYFTVMPDGALRFDRTPDAPLDIIIAYRRSVHELLADSDVPILPPQHHQAIVWRALMSYADSREKTQESYQKWERRRNQAMARLYREQLPELGF